MRSFMKIGGGHQVSFRVSFKTNKCTKQMIDLMHDEFERLLIIQITIVLNSLILVKKIITWQKVNLRIHNFSSGNLETGNKLCPLTIERVKGDNVISEKQSVYLKISAARMAGFSRYLWRLNNHQSQRSSREQEEGSKRWYRALFTRKNPVRAHLRATAPSFAPFFTYTCGGEREEASRSLRAVRACNAIGRTSLQSSVAQSLAFSKPFYRAREFLRPQHWVLYE